VYCISIKLACLRRVLKWCGKLALTGETIVFFVFIVLAISALNNGGWSTDHFLVWGPAMVLQIPFKIIGAIASTAPLLVPLAVIALLAYFTFLENTLGEAFVTLVVFGAVVVMLGV